jgi:TolA-binding protein
MSSSEELPVPPSGTPGEGVEFWQRIAREQQVTIERLEQQLKRQQARIEQLEAEIRLHKKLKGKPQLKASQLNQPADRAAKAEKRGGFGKRRKKPTFEVDEEVIIEPVCHCTIMPQKPIFESLSPVVR